MFAVQGLINLALLLVAVGMALFGLIDALGRPARAFEAADKLTKPGWLLILSLALISALLFNVLGLIGLIGVVASGVYLADVRPALRGLR